MRQMRGMNAPLFLRVIQAENEANERGKQGDWQTILR
jgi:hypothetical protein